MTPSDKPEGPDTLTKREFLRKVVVGGTVMFVAGGGYERPELETLLGPQVAHATGTGHYDWKSYDWQNHEWNYEENLAKWREWLEKLFSYLKKD